jgi:2',5'-phosphodiesterase
MNIGETVKTHPACQELFQKLHYNEQLISRLTDRSTTLQVVLLRSKEFPQKYFLVANTHLYFHPDADHIRLLQISFSMLLVDDFMKKFKEKYSSDLSLIFCGDFNSVPECGIYKLMTEGHVPSNFIDWSSKKEEEVLNVEISQPYKMQSACGTPKFTNYTVGFKECLDYIFYQTEKFEVTKAIEMPTDEELGAHIAIPSVLFPSDHVAIIAELKMN